MTFLWCILIGTGEALLASMILKRYGHRFIVNFVVGISASLLTGSLIGGLTVGNGNIMETKMALSAIGSFIVLFALNLTAKKRPLQLNAYTEYADLESHNE